MRHATQSSAKALSPVILFVLALILTACSTAPRQGIRPVRATDRAGADALIAAVRVGDKEAVVRLLDRGVPVNAVGSRDIPPLFAAVTYGKRDIAACLLQRGARADIISPIGGETPLIQAVLNDDMETLRLLVDHGADINLQDFDGHSALFETVVKGNVEIARYLLDKGADMYMTDNDGDTILERSSGEIMKMLIRRGADPGEVFPNGRTPLIKAVRNGDMDLVSFLVREGASLRGPYAAEALTAAIDADYLPIARYLVERGVDVNGRDRSKKVPLDEAMRRDLPFIEYLLDKGADPNVELQPPFRGRALLKAAYSGRRDVVFLLLQRDADINIRGYNGNTALMEASQMGHLEIVELLLSRGAGIDLQNESGETALMKALWYKQFFVFQYLVAQGADINLRSNAGLTVPFVIERDGLPSYKEVIKAKRP